MKGALVSPSFRKSKPPLEGEQPKKIGCIPSIFFFFHSHSRKRLSAPSGKKDKSTATPEHAKPAPSVTEKKVALKRAGPPALSRVKRRESSETPTPKTPAPIRLSAPDSPETPRRSPALVARLMGLEDLPEVSAPESAAEKRRKLLGALEKCDEDLKALRAIIEGLRATRVGTPGGESKEAVSAAKEEEEQPSPVSVLDAPSASPPTKREKRKKGFSLRATMERVPWRMCRRKLVAGAGKGRRWSSRALVESVEEVWKEGVWGQRWERGRVAVALEGGILGDLMEEIIWEMEISSGAGRLSISSSTTPTSLPFESCRRRLRF